MSLLKDKEREQLRQLVKACLLEISKLKIDLKKSQKEANEFKVKAELINLQKMEELEKILKEKNEKISELTALLNEKDAEMEELKNLKIYFDALTARPKRDLTSFQSQVYQLLKKQGTTEDLYEHILSIGFKELSFDNFNSILRNLERKGYFRSSKGDDTLIWEKIEK